MSLRIAKISNNKTAITTTCDSLLPKAQKLASLLHLPLVDYKHNNNSFLFLLTLTSEHIELRETNIKHAKSIFVDFLSPKLNYRIKHGGGKKQLLAKAIGIKNKKGLFVIDATAGFGVDAFVLASLGCKVVMLERSPIIGILLADGLKRLKKNPKIKNLKINLYITQAVDYIDKISRCFKSPEVIYLDPMYPKRYNSALNKKTMRILHELVGDDSDAYQILEKALKCAKDRVVVKRPRHADYLGGLKPNLQFSSGGSSRYDVYFTKK